MSYRILSISLKAETEDEAIALAQKLHQFCVRNGNAGTHIWVRDVGDADVTSKHVWNNRDLVAQSIVLCIHCGKFYNEMSRPAINECEVARFHQTEEVDDGAKLLMEES